MKRVKAYTLLLLLFGCLSFVAQTDTLKKHASIKLKSVSFNAGIHTLVTTMSLKDLRNSGIDHTFLDKDYSSFSAGHNQSPYDIRNGGYVLATANYIFYNKQKAMYYTRHELNVRVCINPLEDLSYEFRKTTSIPFDTLFAKNSAQQYFVTRTTSENYNITYKSSNVMLELGYRHYLRDQIKQWNAFGGIGFGLGKTFSNFLNTTHTYYETFTNQYGYIYYEKYNALQTSIAEDAYNIKLPSRNIQKAVVAVGLQHRIRQKKYSRMDITSFCIEAFAGVQNTQQVNRRYYQSYFYAVTASIKLYLNREKYR